MVSFVIIVCIVALGGFWFLLVYNHLMKARQAVSEGWADIAVQLKRRHDLIPNLIAAVSGYASYEKNLFTEITELREKSIALPASNIQEKSTTEANLENSLHSLLAVAENYPDLKASSQFLKLQQELVDTEDEIASARRIYNENVATFNTAIVTFPNNLVALSIHAVPAAFFQNQEVK